MRSGSAAAAWRLYTSPAGARMTSRGGWCGDCRGATPWNSAAIAANNRGWTEATPAWMISA